MKTAMKRLLSFVLVAMMLVSVVPFQASAAGAYTATFVPPVGDRVVVQTGDDNKIDTSKVPYGNWVRKDNSTISFTEVLMQNETLYNSDGTYPWTVYAKDANGNRITYATLSKNGGETPSPSDAAGAISASVPNYANYDAVVTQTGDFEMTVVLTLKKYAVTLNVNVLDKDGVAITTEGKSGIAMGDLNAVSYSELVTKALTECRSIAGIRTYTVKSVEVNSTPLTSGSVPVTAAAIATVTLTKAAEKQVTFYAEDGVTVVQTVGTQGGKLLSGTYPLTGPVKEGKVFEGWYSGGSNGSGSLLNADAPADQYYAHYSPEKNGETDGVSGITLYCKVYADDKVVDEFTILPREVVVDHTNVLDWLKNKKDAILVAMNDEGYGDAEWNDFRFFDNATNEPLTQADEILGANKYIYVKLDLEDTARVLVCVHGKVGTAGTYYKMDGYLSNGNYTSTYIQKSDVISFLKTKYNVSSSNVDGLYGEQEWKELVDEQRKTGTGVTSYRVKDNDDTTIVHVILTNASLKGANSSDNPKTGDTILMAVTVLGLSAAALAAVYFFNKKKQSA